MSKYAPRMYKLEIPQDKIGTVIGPGGKTVRTIIEETNTTVDINNEGFAFIGSAEAESAHKAIKMIEDLIREVEVGAIYTGKVTRIMTFGAFVEILPGKEGLVHISELADYRVERVEDVVAVGDELTVKVAEIDNQGRINLSRRAVFEKIDNLSTTRDKRIPFANRQMNKQQNHRSVKHSRPPLKKRRY